MDSLTFQKLEHIFNVYGIKLEDRIILMKLMDEYADSAVQQYINNAL